MRGQGLGGVETCRELTKNAEGQLEPQPAKAKSENQSQGKRKRTMENRSDISFFDLDIITPPPIAYSRQI